MDIDRPHRSNSSCSSTATNAITSELFICFTSRLSSSSSSMKISSKSILSPGRSRESSQISLPTSLSRRLRTSGSMRSGQASPMFPTNAKKRGSFENPEPSSPKVTCIGQVRVKTKKQGKKLRSRSQRRSGDVSFRRVEKGTSCHLDEEFSHSLPQNQKPFLNQQQQECSPHRNQKWVHLPLTICEALREFNCFLPCRSSCTPSEKDKEEKAAAAAAAGESSNGSSISCGAVFGRWLVAVQEGDGKGREIELVVGEEKEEEEEEITEKRRRYRRHVFEEIDFKEGRNGEVEEEEARVSICIPPKNALLLMRCRSDPVKMAALANKFWEPPDLNDEEEEQKQEPEEEMINASREVVKERQTEHVEEEMEYTSKEKLGSSDSVEEHQIEEAQFVTETIESDSDSVQQQQEIQVYEVLSENEDSERIKYEEIAGNAIRHSEVRNVSDSSVNLQLESVELNSEENEQELEVQESESEVETEGELAAMEESKEQKAATENTSSRVEEEEETLTRERSESEEKLKVEEGQTGVIKSKEREGPPLLPDCLLLMMCEPKLSMEVSKETWVCGTDFVKWLPEPSRPVKKKTAADEPKKRNSIDLLHPRPLHSNSHQPPRSSCSFPAKPPARPAGTESISTAIEKKLVGNKACEPFILKRCKSEPMRSAAKLAPENCFWENRKLEPHRAPTLGVGAAGVGC